MTYDTIAPRLKLKNTISHPADTGETGLVLGFSGRNVLLGHDANVLKQEELPTIRDSPAVTHFIIPTEQVDEAVQDDVHVYILGEKTVYHIDPIDVSKAKQHTGRKHGEDVEGVAVPLGKTTRWYRSRVEVSN
ncbi:hypothetical protein [Halomonas sp.]|uniref:hypothetical protein n=1 Tax=Halomonas sp. TaxID=1486246 RepID=UPI00356204D8